MAKQSDLKTKIDGLNKAFQFYYKANHNTLRRASDFYLPFIFGRKKRLAEFDAQYIPLSIAVFLEGVRNTTTKMDGKPDEELIDRLRDKLLPKVFTTDFNKYWNVIESELERNPENPKALSTALTDLFMFQIFGPNSKEPNPNNLTSDRHQIAIEFQLGKILYQYSRASRVVLERIKDPNFDAQVIPGAADKKAPETASQVKAEDKNAQAGNP